MFAKQDIRTWTITVLSSMLMGCGGGGGSAGTDNNWLYPLWVNTDVLAADIDGDGRPDVLTLAQLASSQTQRDGRLVVRLQTSSGQFAPAQTYTVGVYPWKLALGDIDGDGAADLVITDVGSASATTDGAVWLLRQDAGQRGHFLAPQRLTTASAYGVAIGDLNGDNLPDIVIAASLKPGRGATVLYQNSAPRGAFLAPTLVALPGDATQVAIGDMNGDGRNDLVARMFLSTSNYVQSTSLGIAYQQPGGELGAAVTLSAQTGLNSALLTIADYNVDGVSDVVEFFTPSSSDYRAKVTTLLQSKPVGAFVAVDTSLSGVNGIDGGTVADLNGDARPDFASVGFYPVGSPTTVYSSLNIFLQNSGGAFGLAATIPMPMTSSRVAANDINGDGLNDLVVLGHDNQVLVLLQSTTAHGSFLAPYFLN